MSTHVRSSINKIKSWKHAHAIFTPAFMYFDSKRRYFRNDNPEHACIIRA